jgi:hypothetical protein
MFAPGSMTGESADIVLAYTTDTGESHTIGVSQGIVKTLDNKYLEFMETGESVQEEFIAPADITFAYKELLDGIYLNCYSTFATEDTYNSWMVAAENGKSVKVVWDGEEYICSFQTVMGMPAVGNAAVLGGANTGEPFAISINRMELDGGIVNLLVIISTDPTPSDPANAPTYNHTVCAYFVTPGTSQIKDTYIPGPPEFDLSKMGLPEIPLEGTRVTVQCDTTELRSAMEKGLVKLKFVLVMDEFSKIPVSGITGAFSAFNGYQCSFVECFDTTVFMVVLEADEAGLYGHVVTLATPTT